MRNSLRILLLILVFSACSNDPDMLDGGIIFDPSLYEPEKYLVSVAHPNPTTEEALKPVIIASHGYTATTFEWDEFRSYAETNGDVLVSRFYLAVTGEVITLLKIPDGRTGRQQ